MPITKTRVILALLLLTVVIIIQSLSPNAFTLFFLLTAGSYYAYLFLQDRLKKPTQTTSLSQVKLFSFLHRKRNYLKSEAWNTKRKLVLQRDSYTCQCCNTTGVPLDVHHLSSYSLIPQEPTSALISLCKSCPEAQHLHYGYPQTLEDYNNWNTTLYKGHL